MNKFARYFVVLVFLTAAFIATAAPVPLPKPETWEWYGEGVTAEQVTLAEMIPPRDWYQLKSDVIKVDGSTRICHGFDDGRYGWTGEIFRLVGGTWVKLPTTVGWVPNEEGHYMACAMAPAAGTYALFGYFDKAKAPEKIALPECAEWGASMSSNWDPPTFYSDYVHFYYPGAAGDLASFFITSSNYPLSGDLTGSAIIDSLGIVNFEAYTWQILVPLVETINFTYRVETPVCYFEWTLNIYQG